MKLKHKNGWMIIYMIIYFSGLAIFQQTTISWAVCLRSFYSAAHFFGFQFSHKIMSIKRFLLYFAQENIDFRYPEIRSLLKFFSLDVKLPAATEKPYWILQDVNETDLKKIASRSVSLRYIFEVWSSGKNYESFHEDLKKFGSTLDHHFTQASFKVTVESYNKHFKHEEKISKIESMNYLPLNGKIDLNNPDYNFIYFEFWGLDPKNIPEEPEEIVFGRWVSKLIAELHSNFIKMNNYSR